MLSLLVLLLFTNASSAREQIRIVGSSTVFPFSSAAGEALGHKTDFKTPVVESTGTGGGFKLFCSGIGPEYPDFSDASRAIKPSEKANCNSNGVKNIIEIKIGYDGIALVNQAGMPRFNFNKKQLFMALARQVPVNGALVNNPYQYWSDIDKSLPHEEIQIYGPPPISGTRDAFTELVMVAACKELPEFIAAYKDESEREKNCGAIREDGVFIEDGDNNNLLIQKIKHNEKAVGILGYSYLEQNTSIVQGSLINGIEPTFDNILSGKYPLSRPLFVYAKGEHVEYIPGMREFVDELLSDAANDPINGYLVRKGLIPLSKEELVRTRAFLEKDGI